MNYIEEILYGIGFRFVQIGNFSQYSRYYGNFHESVDIYPFNLIYSVNKNGYTKSSSLQLSVLTNLSLDAKITVLKDLISATQKQLIVELKQVEHKQLNDVS